MVDTLLIDIRIPWDAAVDTGFIWYSGYWIQQWILDTVDTCVCVILFKIEISIS